MRKGFAVLMKWIESRIPDSGNIRDERVRSAYGKAASLVGIGCNAVLFAGKLAAGVISGSVAITADAGQQPVGRIFQHHQPAGLQARR